MSNKILYRYRPANEWLEKLIVDDEHYFASPRELNDPFECKFDLKLLENKETVLRNLIMGIEEMSAAERKKMALPFLLSTSSIGQKMGAGILEDPLQYALLTYEHGYIRNPEKLALNKKSFLVNKIEKTTGICCFTETPHNTLMYSHYADQHQGVCLGYKISEVKTREAYGPYPVSYTDDFPIWEEFPDEKKYEKIIRSSVLNKSKKWAYEREWRMFTITGKKALNLSNSCDLTELIFGSRITKENRNKVTNLIERHRPNVKIYNSSLSENSYELHLTLLN